MLKRIVFLSVLVSILFTGQIVAATNPVNKPSILEPAEDWPSGYAPFPIYAVGCPDWKLLEIVDDVPRHIQKALNINAVPKTTESGFESALELLKKFLSECKKDRTEKMCPADPQVQASAGPGIYYQKNRFVVEQLLRETMNVKSVYLRTVASSHGAERFSLGRDAAMARYKKVLATWLAFVKLQMKPWGKHPGYRSSY